jgi:protein-S-isoprenylcysteine O-methyltransferase Ste14
MLREIDIPPLWLALFAALAWSIGQAVPVSFALDRLFGGALIGLGLVLMAVAAGQMVLHHTTFVPRRDPSDLVTSGVFALTRNPIYLGDALVLTGLCLWWSAALALPLVPAFMWLITVRFIIGEEAMIGAHFGAKYSDYRAQVRRWL